MGVGDVLDGIEFRFHFQKRNQLFDVAHVKTFSILPMCVSNPIGGIAQFTEP